MSSNMQNIRNIGIIAHIDAGKTTVTERMLFYSKRIHRMGEVHDGNATMDFMPEEQERGITISSACTYCNWQGCSINIVDTPGHVDFTVEVDRSLRVLDGAIGVFCAVGGVEPQSETVWKQSERYKIPKLAFINKADRIGANFESVLAAMQEKLHIKPLLLQLPLGQGKELLGVIDVLRLQKTIYDQNSQGRDFQILGLSEQELSWVQPWQDKALEILAELNDQLLEKYLSGEEIGLEELALAVRQGTLEMKFVPTFVGSALKNIGIQPLMDAVKDYLPSPLQTIPAQGIDPVSKKTKFFEPDPQAPLSALAFKVTMEAGRKLIFLRIYSGTIRSGDVVYNATRGVQERVARLFIPHAGKKEKIDQASAGQIVAVGGLRSSSTADTICHVDNTLILERIDKYRPVISFALEPKNSAEEEKLEQALDKVLQEDPTLFLQKNEDTEQLVLSGMGELHLEVVMDRLRREYKAEFRSGTPQVVYQETVKSSSEITEEFCRELGGELHCGGVVLSVEPLERGLGNDLRLELDENQCVRHFLDAACKGIQDGLQAGCLKGYPVQDVRVRLQELKDVNGGSDIGYRMAAMGALRKALQAADSALLEPIMRVEISVPEEFVGECIGLLGSKGGKIENMLDQGRSKIVQALTPLRQMFGFSTQLRSATQGRAGMSMFFERFDLI